MTFHPSFFSVACPRAGDEMINRIRVNTLKHDHDMLLSLLHLDLVFYFSLGITETRVFIPSHSFNNSPKDDSIQKHEERSHVTHHEKQQQGQLCIP
jgi:hypothetical protein